MRRKLKDWDEQDLVYARRWYKYLQRKGETRRIKRLMHKRWRREDKALVCFETTYPDVGLSEPREVLQDRRGYTSVDYWYFENFIMPDWYEAQDFHLQHMEEGKYTSQSEGY